MIVTSKFICTKVLNAPHHIEVLIHVILIQLLRQEYIQSFIKVPGNLICRNGQRFQKYGFSHVVQDMHFSESDHR